MDELRGGRIERGLVVGHGGGIDGARRNPGQDGEMSIGKAIRNEPQDAGLVRGAGSAAREDQGVEWLRGGGLQKALSEPFPETVHIH